MFLYKYPVLIVLLLLSVFWHNNLCAQTKKKSSIKTDTTAPKIIYKTEKDNTRNKNLIDPAATMRKKVTVIRPYDTVKPTYKDTVIILKKGLSPEEVAERQRKKTIELMKNNNYCKCVKMDIDVPSVLAREDYLNYKFVFKNECKIDVWISSQHFRFTPYDGFGKPVKVLRKLSFAQRYNHPKFVKLMPDETYTFDYADDAFFEYDLKKGQTYKFEFEHRNLGTRSKMAPSKTYFCHQKRTQLITVK